jgi:aspartyl protease family protein
MGTFKVSIEVGDPAGQRWERVEALADTGATLTVVPRSLWDSLGLQTNGSRTFDMADGSEITLPVGEARIRIGGEDHTNTIAAGPEEAGATLGAVTLEISFLAVDPARRRLVPVRGLLR